MSINWKDNEEALKAFLPNVFKDDLFLVSEKGFSNNPKNKVIMLSKDDANVVYGEMRGGYFLINAYNEVKDKTGDVAEKTLVNLISYNLAHPKNSSITRAAAGSQAESSKSYGILAKSLNNLLQRVLNPNNKEKEYVNSKTLWEARKAFSDPELKGSLESVKESLRSHSGSTEKLFKFYAKNIVNLLEESVKSDFENKLNKLKDIPEALLKRTAGTRGQVLNGKLDSSARNINDKFRFEKGGI